MLLQISSLSIAIWLLGGISYLGNHSSFRSGAAYDTLGEAMLLLGFGLLGSLVQLPGGGSQQFIVIAVLENVVGLSAELAVSCGILGWLTILMAPVPTGLTLLRHEGLSLRGLSRKL